MKNMKIKENMGAWTIWGSMMIAYFFTGLIYKFFHINFINLINIIFTLVCLFLIKLKKDEKNWDICLFATDKKEIVNSCKYGIFLSVFIFILNGILPGVLYAKTLSSISSIITNFIYYIVIIALPEEVVFRGYMMNRFLYTLKDSKKAIIWSGILFVLIHIPFQLVVSRTDLLTWLLNGNGFTLIMTFFWHLIFCLLYKKLGTLWGVVLFHGIMDWSNCIFL
jgi:hypothetical protein